MSDELARDPQTAMRKAAAVLRTGRWIRGAFSRKPSHPKHLQQYGYCVIGALRHVVSGEIRGLGRPLPPEQEAIVRAAAKRLPIPYAVQGGIAAAIGWNDGRAKSKEEVIAALEKGAKFNGHCQ